MRNIESGQPCSFTDRVFKDALTACHLSACLGTCNLSLGPNFPTFVRRKTRPIHMMRPQWLNWTLLTSWELLKLDLSWNAVTSYSGSWFNIICFIRRRNYEVFIILSPTSMSCNARREIHLQWNLWNETTLEFKQFMAMRGWESCWNLSSSQYERYCDLKCKPHLTCF